MKINPKAKNIFFQISAILILLSAIAYPFVPMVAKYAMIIGAAGFAATTFTNKYPGKSLRGKRIFNIQVFAAILMAVSAYLMFVDMKEWVVTLLVAALLTLYSTIVLSMTCKKELEEKSKQ